MGIWISEPYQDFTEVDYIIGQSSSGNYVKSSDEYISKLSLQLGRNFSKTINSDLITYITTDWKEIPSTANYENYLPQVSPADNISLPTSYTVTQYQEEDEDYKIIRTVVHGIFSHIPISGKMGHKRIASNNARIIYERFSREWVTEEDKYSDGYTEYETFRVVFYFIQKVEKDKPDVDPVIPTAFGAFPNGLGADYCYLACRTDESYASNWTEEQLNEMANDYAGTTDLTYYGTDARGTYVLVQKSGVDNSTEIRFDWANLYGDDFALENTIVQCEVNGVVQECYKIYLTGQCQLLEFDGTQFIQDQGGTTDVPEYNLPNGYYVIIGKQLRLFLLTDIDSCTYPYNGSESTIKFSNNSTVGNGVTTVHSRQTYYNNRWYIYKGQATENISSVDEDSVIFAEISNLRKLVLSDTIVNVGHFGGQANPDGGFYFPKYLETIGPLTITYTAGTDVYIPTQYLKTISDNAFYNGVSVNTNMRLYMCDDPQAAKQNYTNGYVAPTATLEYIGKQAFYGLKIDVLNLTNCPSLAHIKKEAFALDNTCKNIYLLDTQLSERTGATNNDLAYLPDEATSIVDSPVPYDSSVLNSCTYANNTYRTFGSYLGGYRFHFRDNSVDIEDIT